MELNLYNRLQKGFTLIELLVVIAIIAILSAILFPVFASAREKARQTTCASNGRQIATALIQYSIDYDEFLPQSGFKSPAGVNGNSGWQIEIEPYVKAGATFGSITTASGALPVYVCPDFQTTWIGQDSTARYTSSYAANRYLMPWNLSPFNSSSRTDYFTVDINGTYYAQSTNLSKINFPAQQVAFAEAEGVRYSTDGNDTGAHDGASDGDTATDSLGSSANGKLLASNQAYALGRSRHSGGGNYVFADGHVKWFKAPGSSYTNVSSGKNGTCTANPASEAPGISGGDPCTSLTPIESQSNVVYSHAQFPNAPGFFTEN
jgi:prepilin-type N-terminal cleavage/methylation domain-containing protein/prepilin-type processing-associated H-X9-DG protein